MIECGQKLFVSVFCKLVGRVALDALGNASDTQHAELSTTGSSLLTAIMDDLELPSASTVNSRFVSQSEIDVVKNRREEQWKAAYAR